MSNGIINLATVTTGPAAPTKPPSKRANQPRLKVVIRRLPPGMPISEFEKMIGPEWKVGAGRVDWINYREGKPSKDRTKHARQTRVYMNLTDKVHVAALSEAVQAANFVDPENVMRTSDNVFVAPPSVEFAPFNRVPASRKRRDARQGTIDQDPEFIQFLESLTNPLSKPHAELEPHKEDKITTTPLIEHIREKKARQEKPGAKSKERDSGKKRKGKGETSLSSPEKTKKLTKPDRAAKEAVKVLNRQASSASAASSQTSEKASPSPATSTRSERRKERPVANFDLAAKIQRDLGLGPSSRRGRGPKAGNENTASTTVTTPKHDSASETSTPETSEQTRSPRPERRARDRRPSKNTKADPPKTDDPPKPPLTILKKPPTIAKPPSVAPPAASTSTTTPTTPATASTIPTVSAPAGRRAFLKHANPSQGITEEVLRTALEAFGSVTHVEIDKRKGIAYADFAESTGLAAAIAKGKVDVAKGTVLVSEYKERAPRGGGAARVGAAAAGDSARGGGRGGKDGETTRGGRGFRGRGRGRGGNAAAGGQTPAPASSA
ncbi:hypothetical protein BT63DRAFT_292550 [Microthyrium microscopicum]|uniref:RRM domain-containing protein n=1 Tax=Microthyrium microscopicum TaxID=703497 RepID=A0A6A6U683_9PEZI|nr:hypothetical protein BT63DRAFT_292550 [Microthyrium microscopicum]